MRIEPIVQPVERIYPLKDTTKKQHTSDENSKNPNQKEQEQKQPEQKGKVLTKKFDVYI